MSSVPPARCARHDLAPGPDGHCVLCRRELQGATAIEIPAEPARLPGWVLGVVAAALVVGAAAFTLRESRPAPQPSAAATPPLAAAQPAQPALDQREPAQPREKSVEEQIADAERARAERERQIADAERAQAELDHQIAEEQRAEVRRRMEQAEAKRKLAEQASDKKRHALVTRELDKASLASARSRVNITMYSTSWCRACKQARAYMESHQISFTEYDVDHDAAARSRAEALNPRGSVPTISIDGDVMVGFSPKSLESRIENAARKRKGS